MRMDGLEVYTVGVQEFDADEIVATNGQKTNKHRQKLKGAGVFAMVVAGRCLFTASRKQSVGSYALGYVRKTASCSIWYKDYLGALPSHADAQIQFYLCAPEDTRKVKKEVDAELKPFMNPDMAFSKRDEAFLDELFPGVRERQEYLQGWKAKGVHKIRNLEYSCRDSEELLALIADLPLEEIAEEHQRIIKDAMLKS